MSILDSSFEIKDNYAQCNYLYGGEDFIITKKDLIALLKGKILNADVNWEYGITIKLSDDIISVVEEVFND